MILRLLIFFLIISSSVFAQSEWTLEDILATNDSIKLPGTLSYDQ